MISKKKILVLLAHPSIHRSRLNRAFADAIRELPNVTLHDLYHEYPDHIVNMKREQELLLNHDGVVFQHPFYWYSCPSLLKEWMDIVLEYGFAYGQGGTALHGKFWMQAITTGGPEAAYKPDGYNRFTIQEFLRPFDQSAHLCGMKFSDPFVTQGSYKRTDDEIKQRAKDYVLRIQELQK